MGWAFAAAEHFMHPRPPPVHHSDTTSETGADDATMEDASRPSHRHRTARVLLCGDPHITVVDMSSVWVWAASLDEECRGSTWASSSITAPAWGSTLRALAFVASCLLRGFRRGVAGLGPSRAWCHGCFAWHGQAIDAPGDMMMSCWVTMVYRTVGFCRSASDVAELGDERVHDGFLS